MNNESPSVYEVFLYCHIYQLLMEDLCLDRKQNNLLSDEYFDLCEKRVFDIEAL